MQDMIRIAGLIEESIVDGPGIRFVVFAQGCVHKCPGCHNPHTHNTKGGYDIAIEDIVMQIRQNPLIDGVTFSGGEPFLQAGQFFKLAKRLKQFNYNILAYSGYTFEQLLEQAEINEDVKNLLNILDILIDGLFKRDKMDYALKFRGSSNQRIIDVQKSLNSENGEVKLFLNI